MTPSRFAELNDRLIEIELRLFYLANAVQGTVLDPGREVVEINSSCDAFSKLCVTTTQISDVIYRLEVTLTDQKTPAEGLG